jgi:hypothetical protein
MALPVFAEFNDWLQIARMRPQSRLTAAAARRW